jgi:hypothetical protein
MSAALVAFIAAVALIYGFARILPGSTGRNDGLAADSGVKLADPDAVAGAAPPIDSLLTFLSVVIPTSFMDMLIALLGGALVFAVVLTAMKFSRSRPRG